MEANLVSFMISDGDAQRKEIDAAVRHGIGHLLRKCAHRSACGAYVVDYHQSFSMQGVGISYAEGVCKVCLTLKKRHGGLSLVRSAGPQR